MDCSLPGSSVHGILQVRILEWVAISFSRGSSPLSVLKSKDIPLPSKVCIVQAMVFPVVMYGYESRTIGKAECPRIDAFKLWCWRRLLRDPGIEPGSSALQSDSLLTGLQGKPSMLSFNMRRLITHTNEAF